MTLLTEYGPILMLLGLVMIVYIIYIMRITYIDKREMDEMVASIYKSYDDAYREVDGK